MYDMENDPEGLAQLSKDVDAFTSKIFDHVSYLSRVDFLHTCYEFKHDIEDKIKSLGGEVK